MLVLPSPKSSFDVKPNVSIKGVSYKFTYRWNSRTSRWKLDIESNDSSVKVYGLTLIENIDLTSHLLSIGFTWGGFIMVVPITNTSDTLGRSNFGSDKDYELMFIDYLELDA